MTLSKIGVQLRSLPVSLEYVRTLEFFEGDRLVELRTPSNETYLGIWFDCLDTINRWLYVRANPVDVAKFLEGRRSLRDILVDSRDGVGYLADLDAHERIRRVAFIPLSEIEASSLPNEESFHDPDLAPETGGNEQAILVDGKWSGYLLSLLERRYTQVYSFLALAGGKVSSQRVQTQFENYRIRGGWIQHTIFTQILDLVPKELQPSMTSVQIASPGLVRYNVDPDLGSRVRKALRRFQDRRDDAERAYNALHDILLDIGAARNKSNQARIDTLKKGLAEPIRQLAAVLGQVRVPSLLQAAGNNPENAGQLLAAYWRKLSELDRLEREDRAKIV